MRELSHYPRVEVDIEKFKHNAKMVISQCKKQGIEVAGVIKGFNGIPEISKAFAQCGCSHIASSRLDQIKLSSDAGIDKPFMLIRTPMISEVEKVIEMVDISLNSEVEVLKCLNKEAINQKKKHKVILMADLGDIREGFWDKEDLIDAALMVEKSMEGLELAGIGTNLGCYGSIAATVEKMEELVELAEMIEKKIGRKLQYISGGATSSFPRVIEGNMPERINALRIGEGIILAKDLKDLWGYDMSNMYQDVFTLKAEVIEVKNKPTYPVGEIMFDSFGHRPEYKDRGIRKRALLALGKVDYAFLDELLPREKGIEIVGASSDHTIIDVEEAERNIKVGDVMEFDLCYATLVYVTNSPNVDIVLV